MSITKFPGHVRSTKLNFLATVLTLGSKARIFGLSERFGRNCARAPCLTAVWHSSHGLTGESFPPFCSINQLGVPTSPQWDAGESITVLPQH